MPPWTHSAFALHLPLLEKIARPIVVYLALIVLLRFFGKRELAQLNPFDLVVLLSLSNTVQNAIIGDDNSVTGGLIGAFSLLGINFVTGWLVFRSHRLDRILGGAPTVLVDSGKVRRGAMLKELMTHSDLMTVLHRQGFDRLEDVERCVLEPGGSFFIKRKGKTEEEEQRSEILKRLEEMKAQLDALSRQRPSNV